jgi:hypothetical protein
MLLANSLCDKMQHDGYFADFFDPCSGLPSRSDSNQVFSEVEAAQILLGYK